MQLSVRNLQKYYGRKGTLTKALDNISFDIEQGEFTAIMGPSGSGKTTLLNCISTLDAPTSGNLLVNGCDITEINAKRLAKFRRDHLSFVFQEYNLLDTMTAYENIALALSVQHAQSHDISLRVHHAAKLLNISAVLDKYPIQMSGGQQQRVAVARAIVTNPSLLLADEPTGALDSRSARLLLESLQMLNNKLQTTILLVTHDAFTASFCNRVLFLKDGKLFNELIRGDNDTKQFFNQIVEVMVLLGGNIYAS